MFAKKVFLCGSTALMLLTPLFAQSADNPPANGAAKKDWAQDAKEHLPAWLGFGGQYRGRIEGQTGRQFQPGNDDLYYLSRLRLNLDFHPDPHFHVFLQGQDAHAPGLNIQPRPATHADSFDLRQAYVEAQRTESSRSMGIKLGRQELSFGEDRLVGPADWLNTARSFDAARAYFSTARFRVDAFAASVVRIRDAFNNPQSIGNNFYGVYGSLKQVVPRSTLEPYFFYKTIHRIRSEKGNPGSAGIFTFGARLAGKLPASFDYGIESAGQAGDVASDPQRAWAGHWLLGYTAGSLKTTPRFLVEYNYASGDRSATDGKRGTFDQLYPTNHYKYGAIDLLGWRNLRSMRAGSEMKLRPKLTVSLSYLSHWLAQASDALYSGSGSPVFRLPPGASGRHVGREFDLVFLGALSKQYSLGLGYARLWAGSFLKQAAGGSDFSYPYAFLAYNF